jgi:hypothetical protein
VELPPEPIAESWTLLAIVVPVKATPVTDALLKFRVRED